MRSLSAGSCTAFFDFFKALPPPLPALAVDFRTRFVVLGVAGRLSDLVVTGDLEVVLDAADFFGLTRLRPEFFLRGVLATEASLIGLAEVVAAATAEADDGCC